MQEESQNFVCTTLQYDFWERLREFAKFENEIALCIILSKYHCLKRHLSLCVQFDHIVHSGGQELSATSSMQLCESQVLEREQVTLTAGSFGIQILIDALRSQRLLYDSTTGLREQLPLACAPPCLPCADTHQPTLFASAYSHCKCSIYTFVGFYHSVQPTNSDCGHVGLNHFLEIVAAH